MSIRDRIRYFENIAVTDNCICTVCGLIFNNDDEYDDHECAGERIENVIPTVDIEGFQCPLCDSRYSSPNILGEHFISSHSSYDDMLVLDENIVRDGFPGFDVLEYIKMFEYLIEEDVNKLIEGKEECFICTEEYVPYVKEYVSDKNYPPDDGYSSDSSLTDHRRSKVINKYIDIYKKMDIQYTVDHHIIILKDERLVEVYNDCRLKEHSPIKLTCCNNMICLPCLQNHLTQTASLTCPFCKKDHTVTNMKYVTYIDEVDEIDKTRWIGWWRKHVDIFF